MNFPELLWDSLGYAATWAASTICTDLYPYLLGIGAGMIAVGIALRFIGTNFVPNLRTRLDLGSRAWSSRFWNSFDRTFNTQSKIDAVWTQNSTEGAIAAAAAEPQYTYSTTPLPSAPVELEGPRLKPRVIKPDAPPLIEGGRPPEAQRTKPTGDGGEASPASAVPPKEPALKPQGPGLPPLPDPPPIQGPPEKPVGTGTPTVEAEAKLGSDLTEAKDKMRAAIRAKDTVESRKKVQAQGDLDNARTVQGAMERDKAEDEMRRALATREGAETEYARLSRQIKETQAARREAKAALNVHEKAKSGGKIHRGAVEGMDKEYFAAEIP